MNSVEFNPAQHMELEPNFQTAIDTLSHLQDKVGPASLAYFVSPNIIITLSGARAYCNGVLYPENNEELQDWTRQIAEYLNVLKSTTDVYFSESNTAETAVTHEQYAGFDVLLTEGLSNSLKNTQLLDDTASTLIEQKLTGKELMDEIVTRLKKNDKLSDYSEEDLRHIAFGILVGYPDKAITASIDKWGEDRSEALDPLIDARIAEAAHYSCPQPVYSYPKSLENDPDIVAHERLWSSILQDFYKSDFHKKLAKDPAFQVKAKELGLYE